MKKTVILALALFIFLPRAYALDFYEFYSVFSSSKLILPDRLVIKCALDERQTVRVTTRPNLLTGLKWEISDENIAQIEESDSTSATVYMRGVGECTLTCTHPSSGASAQVRIYVSEKNAHISLSSNALTLKRGESAVIYAKTDGESPPAWTSEDTDILTLSGGQNVCRVYARKGGDTLVHATVPGASASVNVHVEQNRTGLGIKIISLILIISSLSLLIVACLLKMQNRPLP